MGLQIPAGDAIFLGDTNTDGSIKITNDGGGMKHSVYMDGSYKNISSHKQGYDLNYNTDYLPDCSFDPSTRTVTVEPQAGQSYFYFFSDGKFFIKDAIETIVVPDVSGTYYVYFDASGVIQYVEESNVDLDDFYKNAITFLVYWNATESTGIGWNEKHGIDMSATTHIYNHLTYGARYATGMDISGLVSLGKTFSNISSGSFYDEDILHTVTAKTSARPMRRDGPDGDWKRGTADSDIGYKPSGNTYYVWNEWDGSTWKLTEGVSDSDFYIYFFVAFPGETDGQIYKIPGQNAYANAGSARDAISTEVSKLVTDGLPGPEFIFLYAMIIKRNGGLRKLDNGDLYLNLRETKGSAGISETNTTLWERDITNETLSPSNEGDTILASRTIGDDINSSVSLDSTMYNRFINVNTSSTLTLTIDSTLDPSVGTEIELLQKGTNKMMLSAGSGVTLLSKNSYLSTNKQYSVIRLKYLGASTRIISGDLS